MRPWLVANLAAALAAAAPGAAGEPTAVGLEGAPALAVIPAGPLAGLPAGALPPPPTTVVRETRYYGTVTIDHRAHLARRARCKACHGPGAVSKIAFTPKIAHERCIGCHREESAGPAECAGCHVRSPPQAAVAAVATTPGAPAEPPRPAGPDAGNVAAALAAFEERDTGVRGRSALEPFHRLLEMGVAAGDGPGVSVRLATHEDFVVVTQSFDRVRSGPRSRTFAMFGAGHTRPVYPRVSFQAIALGGFDVLDRPVVALLPAIGARAGLDWRPPSRFFQHVTASLTGVVDLSRRASGRDVGGITLYGTVGTGFGVP